MKIYFDASGRGFDEYGEKYNAIVGCLEKMGFSVLNNTLSQSVANEYYEGSQEDRVKRYSRLIKLLKESDIVVLEISTHSLSMGYWLQKALELSKPIIALYFKGHKPFFVDGVQDEKLQVIEYTLDDLDKLLEYAISYASDQQDTRFNFFISPIHQSYLDWIAKNRKIPRSVFLRRVIEKHKEENEEYQG